MVNIKPNIVSPIRVPIFGIFRFRLGGVSSGRSSFVVSPIRVPIFGIFRFRLGGVSSGRSSSTSSTICSSAIYLSK